MRIGLIAQLNGRPGGPREPTWQSIRELALTAEAVGFDIFVFEDALLYRSDTATNGTWESMAIAAALAEATSTIEFGQSVVNAPYRSPAMTASIASTLDEISGGRYVLGIGAGNAEDLDYLAFGFPLDHRYSRFAEGIEILHSLLRTGSVDFDGRFWSATEAELVLRGPNATGPRITIAAGGPKMLALTARYGDEWNWWAWDEAAEDTRARLTPIIETLDAACAEVGRDPSDLVRTLDFYSVVPPGFDDDSSMSQPLSGTAEEIAEAIAALGDLGITEVRIDLTDKGPAAVEAMAPVVGMLHSA